MSKKNKLWILVLIILSDLKIEPVFLSFTLFLSYAIIFILEG